METLNRHQEGGPKGCPGLAPKPNVISVTAKSPQGSAHFVLPQETTIGQFKEELSKHFKCERRQLVLVFSGRILKDQRTLWQSGISDGTTVHLVIRSLRRGPEDSTQASHTPRTSRCALAPTGPSLALPALSPISQASWAPEWPQMPTSEMVVQKVRQLILANPEIQQLAQQFPAICHILNNMGIMRVILDKMREIMELAKNPDVEEELKNPESLLIGVQSNTPGGDNNPLRQLHSEAQEGLLATLGGSPCPQDQKAWGGEGGGSFPISNGYGRFCTNNSSNDGSGCFSSLPAPLGPSLPSLGPNIGAGPGHVGGIQALIVNLCNAYTQRVMLSLLQNALLASEGMQAGRQDHLQQQLQRFYRQVQKPEMVAALSNPKAIQAWVQMEQGLQVLREEAPVLIAWFLLRLKGLGDTSATGAVATGSPLEEEPAALE